MTLPSYEKLGVFYLGREFDPQSQAVGRRRPLRLARPDDPRGLHRHDRQRQDRPVPVAARGGGPRRHPGHRDRPEGRHRQPRAYFPAACGRTTSSRGSTPAKRRARASRVDEFAAATAATLAQGARRVGRGRRAHPAVARRGRASRSTRPARTPGGRCRSCARSRAPDPAGRERCDCAQGARRFGRRRACSDCSVSMPIRSAAASSSCCPRCSTRPGATARASTSRR